MNIDEFKKFTINKQLEMDIDPNLENINNYISISHLLIELLKH